MRFKVGDKIRFKTAYSPEHPQSGRIPVGTTGVVTYASSKNLSGTRRDVQEHVVTVKLDKKVPALADQGNEVEFLWYEDPYEFEGDIAPNFIENAKKAETAAPKRKLKVAVPIEVTLPYQRFPVIKAWSFGEKSGKFYEVPYFEYPEAKRVAVLLIEHGTFTLIDSLGRDMTVYTYREYGVPPDSAYPPGEPDWGVWGEKWIDTQKGEKKTWAIGAREFQWKKAGELQWKKPR